MVRTESPICDFNLPAVEFELKGVDGKLYGLNSLKGPNGLLVMFICNHCPYVKSIINQIILDTKELAELGINSVAIMSNDPNEYKEDSFENMKKISSDLNFSFPYLLDEIQEVAKASAWNSCFLDARLLKGVIKKLKTGSAKLNRTSAACDDG